MRNLIFLKPFHDLCSKNRGLFSSLQGDRATGYGVALLNTLFGKFSGSKLLQAAAPETEINGSVPMETETGGSQSKKMKKS